MTKTLIGVLALLSLAAVQFAVRAPDAGPVEALAQSPAAEECRSQSALRMRLGVGDGSPTDWSGSASSPALPAGVAWKAASESSPLKLAGGGQSPRILPASVDLGLPQHPCGSEVDTGQTLGVATSQGNFEFAPFELPLGRSAAMLDGRVEVERLPASVPFLTGPAEQDYPACAALPDASVLCAFVEYRPGSPVDERAALEGEFGSIEFSGNGDRVALVRRTASGWGYPVYATQPGSDVWRPVVTVLSDGNAAVLWSEQRNGNWDIYLRKYRSASGVLSPRRRLTTDPGQDFNVVASGEYLALAGPARRRFRRLCAPS